MKRMFILITFISLVFSNISFAEDITVKVNGMVCSFCAQGIKRNFESLDSVKEVLPSLENKVVVIKIKDSKTLDDEKIKQIINDAGYQVVSIERSK